MKYKIEDFENVLNDRLKDAESELFFAKSDLLFAEEKVNLAKAEIDRFGKQSDK